MPLYRVTPFADGPGLPLVCGRVPTHPTGPEAAPGPALTSQETLRDLGPGIKQHAQAVEHLASALDHGPARLGAELRAAQDRLAGAVLVALTLGLVVGLVIGRLAGRFRE